MPSNKYDWKKLKRQYLGGSIESVEEFFRRKGISPNTHKEHTKGWAQERADIRDEWIKTNRGKLGEMVGQVVETHIAVGSGLIKVGVDSIVPVDPVTGKALPGLKPETAADAARIIKAGADIQKNAILAARAGLEDDVEERGAEADITVTDSDKRQVRVILKTPKLRKAALTLLEGLQDGE